MNAEIYLWIVLITLIPGVELRGSILFGLAQGVPLVEVFLIAVTVNILLGSVVLFLLNFLLEYALRIKLLERFYNYSVKRIRKNAHHLVEKYGLIGLALFIAVPLPGSGSYSGALAAFILGIDQKKFFVANAAGVITAGIIVSLFFTGAAGVFNSA